MNDPEQIEISIVKKYKKTIWHRFIKASREYSLVNDNDKILCAVTGDERSFLFAKCFARLNKYSETRFDISFAAPSRDESTNAGITETAKAFGIDVNFINCDDTDTALAYFAKQNGYNKLALPSCFDDCVEHTLYSTLYRGSLEALPPRENINGVTAVRAGILVRREDVKAFSRYNGIEHYPAALNENDEKADVRALIAELAAKNPNLEINILRSCEDVNLETIISYIGGGERKSVLDTF